MSSSFNVMIPLCPLFCLSRLSCCVSRGLAALSSTQFSMRHFADELEMGIAWIPSFKAMFALYRFFPCAPTVKANNLVEASPHTLSRNLCPLAGFRVQSNRRIAASVLRLLGVAKARVCDLTSKEYRVGQMLFYRQAAFLQSGHT